MTQDEIIEMAREAGIEPVIDPIEGVFFDCYQEELERFAALVAEKERERIEHAAIGSVKAAILYEREACAKVADGYIGADPIAAAIRARGEA